jgi:hypothetical protein
MAVHVPFPDGPRLVDAVEVKPDKKSLGQKFGKKSARLFDFLASLSPEEAEALQAKLAVGYVPNTNNNNNNKVFSGVDNGKLACK